ncbi:unnamed protein product [Merluccius merluccius]
MSNIWFLRSSEAQTGTVMSRLHPRRTPPSYASSEEHYAAALRVPGSTCHLHGCTDRTSNSLRSRLRKEEAAAAAAVCLTKANMFAERSDEELRLLDKWYSFPTTPHVRSPPRLSPPPLMSSPHHGCPHHCSCPVPTTPHVRSPPPLMSGPHHPS